MDEDRPELSADVAFLSQYIWRGYGLSKDSLVIQPSITAGFKGFALNLWGNLDTDNEAYNGSKWNETDLTFSYGHSFGIVGLEAGYIYYALDGIDDSKEFYLSAGVDVLPAPTLTVYREVSTLQGWYINLGLSHSFLAFSFSFSRSYSAILRLIASFFLARAMIDSTRFRLSSDTGTRESILFSNETRL